MHEEICIAEIYKNDNNIVSQSLDIFLPNEKVLGCKTLPLFD